jgi:hypothetical protein
MAEHIRAGEVAVVYVDHFREYGIRILDGGTSFQEIAHCPWCGCRLPESLRGEWFDSIEGLGLAPGDPSIPEQYLSDQWWRHRETDRPA